VSFPRRREPSVRSGDKMISALRKTLLRFTNWVPAFAGMTRYGGWEREKNYFNAPMCVE
jgi:hypothetical protein